MSNSATPWTAACQAPVSMGFSRQEYWSGLPFPPPGESSQPRDLLCLLRLLQILYHSTTWEAWRVPFSLPNWMRPDWAPSPPIPRYSPFFPDPQTCRGAGLAPFFCLPMYPSRTGVLALPLTSCGDQPGRWRPVIPLPGTHTLLQCLSRGTRRSHVTCGLSEVMYCFGH